MKLLRLLSLLLLAACGSTPPPPDWAMNAHGAMERGLQAYLSGETRVAELEFQRVRTAIASTAQPERLARAALAQCAAEVASLVFSACPAYQALAADAAPPEQAYARYLAGQAQPTDAPLLPEAQRGVLAASASPDAALAALKDPLARLVAAGVLMRSARATPGVIALAVDTASAQGWRRPLAAWLGVQLQRAQAAGDAQAAAAVQRRIDLVLPPR